MRSGDVGVGGRSSSAASTGAFREVVVSPCVRMGILGSGSSFCFLALRSTNTAGAPRFLDDGVVTAGTDNCSLDRWNRRTLSFAALCNSEGSGAGSVAVGPLVVGFRSDLMGRFSSPSWVGWITGREGEAQGSTCWASTCLRWYTQLASPERLRNRLFPSTPLVAAVSKATTERRVDSGLGVTNGGSQQVRRQRRRHVCA